MPKILSDIQNTILSSAEDLFKSRGYQEMDMREIAAHAHIAVGTIYHYYKNKDALFMHVMAHSWQQTLEQMEQISFQQDDPELALLALLEVQARSMENRKSMNNLWTEVATLYMGSDAERMQEPGFSATHVKVAQCYSRVLAKKFDREMSPQEQLALDRLGSFAFVMAVDLCMLSESEAAQHRKLLVDLLSTYMDKLVSS